MPNISNSPTYHIRELERMTPRRDREREEAGIYDVSVTVFIYSKGGLRLGNTIEKKKNKVGVTANVERSCFSFAHFQFLS